MANFEQTINQAIADFDTIEAAIEECGIDVPKGTDTARYGDKIREVHSKAYSDGENTGYGTGYNEGKKIGVDEGYETGYEAGYTKGKEESSGAIPEYLYGFSLRSDEEMDNFEITLPETVTSLQGMFENTRKFKTITIPATGQNITSLRTAFAYFSVERVVNIDFDTSKVKDWYRCFTRSGLGASSSNHTVNGVLDFSSATDLTNFTYNGTTGIYHFIAKSETIKVNMTLHVKVDNETMQSVLNGLATVSSGKTLTVQSYNGETLTTDQIEAAAAKGWDIKY